MKMDIVESGNEFFLDHIFIETVNGKKMKVRKNLSVHPTYDSALKEKRKILEMELRYSTFATEPKGLAIEGDETMTVGGLIEWLSLLKPEQEVRAWENGFDVPFNVLKHIDVDRVKKRIIIDLGDDCKC
jgi:hypothetical protein